MYKLELCVLHPSLHALVIHYLGDAFSILLFFVWTCSGVKILVNGLDHYLCKYLFFLLDTSEGNPKRHL